ncbi:MAG: DUF4262 domain-containing protein, partial [Myxococcales bacterium]|nr:DUF4262 domain-containing protein [Myxococcales bacterium]
MRFAAPKSSRDEASAQVAHHIQTRGQHVHLVHPTSVPGWGHTIGLSGEFGYELILAGAAYHTTDELMHVLNSVAAQLRGGTTDRFRVDGLGNFTLGACDASWSEHLLGRAAAHYGSSKISAQQLVPDREHWTVDTPSLSQRFTPESAPAWRWLAEPWNLAIPETAHVATTLEILQGAHATHIARFEADAWEAFGDEPPADDDVRVVPISVMLAADKRMQA